MPLRGAGLPKLQLPQEQHEQWQEAEEEEEPGLYATDEFRIRVMKVLRCSKKYCHDWTRCPFAHPGEKATRRDPTTGVYTGIACPDMRRDQRCPRGHYCPYAHNVFEYWLHPTRYRTALCRDVDKCTRKICFFAHNMQEIRTNLERPYVSPEQLLAATQAAAADPRVQARYLAAGEQKGSNRNIFSGIDDDDVGQPIDPLMPMPNIGNLSLAAPPSTSQRAETMNAFSSMIRGSPDALTEPQMSLSRRESEGGGLQHATILGNSLSETGMGTGLRLSHSGQQQNEQPNTPAEDQQSLSSKQVAQNQAKPARQQAVPAAGQIHSWGSQQNLLNAAAHLSSDKLGKETSLWSTPRGPLDVNALYSSTSTASDRNMSIDSSTRSLDMRFGQRVRRGKPARRQSNTSIGQTSLSSYNPSGSLAGSTTFTGASYPGHPSLYTASSESTFGMGPDSGLGQYAGMYTDSVTSAGPHTDYAQMLQRDREQQAFQQQQQQFLEMANQNAQSLYEQQLRARIQNTIHPGLGTSMPLAEELRRRELAGKMAAPETGFDLRFGGLGENQGLLTQAPLNANPDSANLYTPLSTLYSSQEAQLQNQFQSDPSGARHLPPASQSYPGSLNASILQQLQHAHGMRSAEQAMPAPRRRSAESTSSTLQRDMDFAARLGFSNASFGRSEPNK